MANQNQKTISWQAPEFRHYEKDPAWYVTLTAISVLIVGFFIIQKDYFGAITMAIIGAMLVFFSRQTPQIVDIELNDKHIKFGNMVFPYKHLKSFWVVNSENHKTLNLETTTYINNLVILELEDQNPEEIRSFLQDYLPEHPQNTRETFAQKLMHKLKF
jgi:hypothetical protein